MALPFLNSSQIELFSGIFARHFPSFAREFIVNKTPKKIITSTTANYYVGYGQTSNESQITYIPVSGTYSGIISYNTNQTQENLYEARSAISKGEVRLKVQKDAYDFIKNGKNESFIVDENTYNIISDEAIQNYLGLQYFYFTLKRTT